MTLAKDILLYILPSAKVIISSNVTIEKMDFDTVWFSIQKTDVDKTKYVLVIENIGIFNNCFIYTLYELDELEISHEIELGEIELQITM